MLNICFRLNVLSFESARLFCFETASTPKRRAKSFPFTKTTRRDRRKVSCYSNDRQWNVFEKRILQSSAVPLPTVRSGAVARVGVPVTRRKSCHYYYLYESPHRYVNSKYASTCFRVNPLAAITTTRPRSLFAVISSTRSPGVHHGADVSAAVISFRYDHRTTRQTLWYESSSRRSRPRR